MSFMNNIAKINKEKKIGYVIAEGVAIAIILSMICIFIYAVVLVNTNIKENTIKSVLVTITGVSILIGSSICGVKLKKNGILVGTCVGVIYFLCLYILSSIAISGFSFNSSTIIMISIGIILGGIGGIIGANIAK